MKNIILILIILAALSSCDMLQDGFNYSKIGGGYELTYSEEWDGITTYGEAMNWIYNNITYKHSSYDDWQSPSTTMSLRSGDCEDMAILFVNIVYVKFGIKANIVAYDSTRTVVEGGSISHIIAEYDGVFYDPMINRVVNSGISVGYIYIFKELFPL
jgi:hypothetical protein